LLKSRFTSLIVAVAILSVALGACRERTLISSSVSPSNDTAGVSTMELSCITHTYYDNSVITSTNLTDVAAYQAAGVVTDPFFGTMTGSTFFQVAPSEAGFTFTANLVADSAILVLPYGNLVYGDTSDQTATQSYQVFYMSDTLGYYSTYYAGDNKGIDQLHPLSDPYTVNVYHLKDSVYATGRNYSALHIPLKLVPFLTKLNPALAAGYSSTDPIVGFVNAFNGLCVRPTDTRTSSTAMPYFRLDGTADWQQAEVLVFYHDTAAPTVADSIAFSYATGSCAHFNNVTKSFSRYPVNNLIHSSQANDSIIALQNQPGPGIDVKIYGINSIPPGVVINKAQLQLTLLPNYTLANYAGPERVYPTGIGSGTYPAGTTAGLTYLLQDQLPVYSLSTYTMIDGGVHTDVHPNMLTYTIGLPREVISSIAAQNDTIHLHLNGTQDYYGAFRMVAAGGNYSNPAYRAKLIVVYSSLKH